jgi:hypothetical protein
MAKTERELVEAARDALRKSEAEWQKAIAAVRGVVTINADAGRADQANAAFGVTGHLHHAMSEMILAHKMSTDTLLALWPDWATEVTIKGPGR